MKVCQIIADERDVHGQYSCAAPYFGSAPAALLEGFGLIDDIEVHVVSCVRQPVSTPERLAENIFYHPVRVSGGYRRSLFVEAVLNIRQKIQQIGPDIVHGQGTEDYQAVCAVFSRHPNCITIHGNMRAVARRLKFRPFPHMAITAITEAVALSKTDSVICNSAYTEQCVGKLNRNKVRIPNAVRSSFFELAAYRANLMPHASCPTPPTPVFLCIGNILPYKNQIGLIRAMDQFPDIGSLRLVFAGGCERSSAYGRRFLEEVNRRSWCEYAGRLGHKDLLDMLKRCSGVIHPTLEDSFGLAVAEAQSAGVPVVASAVGGVSDLICNGETGWLFNPHDPDDICRAVSRLMSSPDAEQMARRAQDFARQEYDPETIARKHLVYYRQILERYEQTAA